MESDHPMNPFIRILGEVNDRQIEVGDVFQWRIVTHTVAPTGISEPLVRQVEIFDTTGQKIFTAPKLEIPPRDAELTRFDNQQESMDCDYEPVIDTDKLAAGSYIVRASLTTKLGKVVAKTELPIKLDRLPRLLHRIKLCWKIEDNNPDRLFLGGVVRVGDVDGDGENEVVHAVGAKHIAVYRLNGELLWRYDDTEGALIYNTAPFRVYDIDGDGRAEIICARGKPGDLKLAILDGETGRIKQQVDFPLMKEVEAQVASSLEKLKADPKDMSGWEGLAKTGHAVRWFTGREASLDQVIYGAKVIVADFRGGGKRDLLVQLGEQNCTTMVAMDNELNILWQHHVADGYGGHQPYACDVDGDGKDEVVVGTRLIDHDGGLIWKKPFEEFSAPWEDDHIDLAEAGPFGQTGQMVIVYSSRLCVDALTGKTLWLHPTWHGQEVCAAKMLGDGNYQFVFMDREYRHSGHLCHGSWFDVRDANGNQLWSYRHAAMQLFRMLDWNGDGLYEVCFEFSLQRRPVKSNLGIFDGHGCLTCVLPRCGFGADIDNDGYDELVSWTQWPDIADTIEIFGMEHQQTEKGQAILNGQNEFAYNEPG
jgi:outer membrane protein assembly factor BamB